MTRGIRIGQEAAPVHTNLTERHEIRQSDLKKHISEDTASVETQPQSTVTNSSRMGMRDCTTAAVANLRCGVSEGHISCWGRSVQQGTSRDTAAFLEHVDQVARANLELRRRSSLWESTGNTAGVVSPRSMAN